jgi:hypothetical protein
MVTFSFVKESQQVGKFSFRKKQISYMIISDDDDSDSYPRGKQPTPDS